MEDLTLEDQYKKLVESIYETVRSDYWYRRLDREEAEALMKLVHERTGVEDPEKEPLPAWQKSHWCVNE